MIPLYGYAAVACSRNPAGQGCADLIAMSAAAEPYVDVFIVVLVVIAIFIAILAYRNNIKRSYK